MSFLTLGALPTRSSVIKPSGVVLESDSVPGLIRINDTCLQTASPHRSFMLGVVLDDPDSTTGALKQMIFFGSHFLHGSGPHREEQCDITK